MEENKKENNEPPYFRSETEDKYGPSLNILELWTEQELSKGNLEKVINFLEQAKIEDKACQELVKIELYDKYIKELWEQRLFRYAVIIHLFYFFLSIILFFLFYQEKNDFIIFYKVGDIFLNVYFFSTC